MEDPSDGLTVKRSLLRRYVGRTGGEQFRGSERRVESGENGRRLLPV